MTWISITTTNRHSRWLVLMLVFLATACSGSGSVNPAVSDKAAAPEKASSEKTTSSLPAFDPATATGRVSGQVLLDGKAPELPSMNISGDNLCKKNALNILKQESVTTVDGKVRNAIVYVRKGYEGKSYAPPETPVVLDQQGCVYLPRVFTAMKGQMLRILNSDETSHNVHARDGERTEFNIGQASKGSVDMKTLTQATMPLRIGCDFHKWMAAYAGVFEHPFHMATGDSGKYELSLPPGKYEIVAWQDKLGEKASMVEIKDGENVKLDFKFSPPKGK